MAIINWPNRVYAALAGKTGHANKTLGKLEEKNYKSHMKTIKSTYSSTKLFKRVKFLQNCGLTKRFQRKWEIKWYNKFWLKNTELFVNCFKNYWKNFFYSEGVAIGGYFFGFIRHQPYLFKFSRPLPSSLLMPETPAFLLRKNFTEHCSQFQLHYLQL